MYLFRGDFGKMLYTGDFRWEVTSKITEIGKNMLLSALNNHKVDTLYIDNTYCNPSYSFPSREVAAQQEASRSKPATDKDKENVDAVALHKRHDSIVLQWIYSTISKDLLITILKPDSTAEQACKLLENIFIDSKPSRALYLENKFSNVKLESFSNVSAYCQELKTLSDQLTNVDAPVSNDRLVLQLINGLGDKFESLATILQQSTPLPDFYTARSKLIPEETRKNHNFSTILTATTSKASTDTATAALNTQTTATTDRQHHPLPTEQQYRSSSVRGQFQQFDYGGRGRHNGRGGRGRGRGRGRVANFHQNYYPQQPTIGWNAPWQPQQWNFPPAPYPTNPVNSYQNRNPNFAGVLGANPYGYAASKSNTPTNIDQAMHTMTLNPDQNWYLDSGATNHMSNTTEIVEFVKFICPTQMKGIVSSSSSYVDPCYHLRHIYGTSSLYEKYMVEEDRERVRGKCMSDEKLKRKRIKHYHSSFCKSRVSLLRRFKCGVKLSNEEYCDD
ncbi:unnamed protein product [Lactuca virosa]|uniref:DNA repair metallo-beta-lactamase domain-containing protein n=1 Tax=Lactuca virosa TaxID=75947 RepID=A0AAU9LM01_9ASTR|nr:unnamed protein product [Lactuca virosa]